MKVEIEDYKNVKIPGVRFASFAETPEYKETYFTCTATGLESKFKTAEKVVCGILEAWHHTPSFEVMEYHDDTETFVYTDGVALMPFCEVRDGKIVPGSAHIVRIPSGTQVEVAGGVLHYVAVAENDHIRMICYCPSQPAIKITLDQVIEA